MNRFLNPRQPTLSAYRFCGSSLALLFVLLLTEPVRSDEPGLLVAMQEMGRVERFDPKTGAHQTTLVSGLASPNVVAEGPDGKLYVSTGAPGGLGAVLRFDARTGRKIDTFVSLPADQPGHLARATGIAWLNGDLIVASQGDGKVHRYDGKSGAWKAHVASATPGGMTQIAVRDGRLYLTDFAARAIRVTDLSDPLNLAPVWVELGEHAPWGIVFDAKGRAFCTTNQNRLLQVSNHNFEDRTGQHDTLKTPVGLCAGLDGRLYAANLHGNAVSVWTADSASDGPVQLITGSAVRGPISVAFTRQPFVAPIQIGNFQPQPSNTGQNWTPTGTAIYHVLADRASAALPAFGIDTEGGDRAKTNLLREPIRMTFTFADGRQIDSWDLAATLETTEQSVRYAFDPTDGVTANWAVRRDRENLLMNFSIAGAQVDKVKRVDLHFPLDPRAMGTTVLAEEWGEGGAVKSPLILSAPDFGQLRLSNSGDDEQLDCWFTGSRLRRRLDFKVVVLDSVHHKREIVFAPTRLRKPRPSISDDEWVRVRRGLISLLQITAYVPALEDGSGFLGSPGGILGNNVLSDPVSVTLERNLQWLAGMGSTATLDGIDLNKIALRTIEFWPNHRMNADGSLDYVLQKGNISADSNTGVLIAATDYYLTTGDKSFVTRNRVVLLKTAQYLIDRDLDSDGLIETFRDGNGGRQFGDTGYDTISSGWKNALVNAQAYKSFLGLARMLSDIGEVKASEDFRRRAVRLRVAYNKTFFDPSKGRYIWWVGQDGKRHDYNNTLVQANAVLYGIADCLEADTGVKQGSSDVMRGLWAAFERAEYFDTAKQKRVDFMDSHTDSYPGFYWGVPNNLEPVPPEYNFQNYGAYEFPFYCNGGIFPLDTVATIAAFRRAGMIEEAEIIRRAIFKRQHEGVFPNGSGFVMGVVNGAEPAYSILRWDGTPTCYEGIISRDCSFLQTTVLPDDPARPLFDEASKLKDPE